MTDFRCPNCGAILHECVAQSPEPSGAIPDATVAQNGGIAHVSKASTKDGRQTYNQDYPAQFVEFWQAYPLHRDKRKALKAWRNAIRRGAIAEILAGAISYRNDPNRLAQFTKYAEGWLNGDGWLDDPLPPRQPSLADWAARNLEPAAPPTMHDEDYRRLLEGR
jgi:hypothetical protein